MRTFYIFSIKNEYASLYDDNTLELYKILKHLYNSNKNNIKYAYNMLFQLTNIMDKYNLNKKIFLKYHNNITYTKNKEEHIINNLYKDEISIMTIKKTYLIINVNRNISSFFKILTEFDSNFFICDFINQDYFWIKDIKTLV